MKVSGILGVNEKIGNVYRTDVPYFWLSKNSNADEEKWAVFFGGAAKDMDLPVDITEYYKAVNQCLDYIRKNLPGLKLYYKPHPSDLDEQKYIDLHGFEILNEKSNAEIFLLKNSSRIKYVFATNSWATVSAYSFGINAYLFLPVFRQVFGENIYKAVEDCFPGMPQNFFVGDLNAPINENKIIVKKDDELENKFRKILSARKGNIWMMATLTDYSAILISLAQMIRDIDPGRTINLLIYKHHRWDRINLDDFKPYFADIRIYPRNFYSLRPERIIRAVKLSRQLKSLPIGEGDIIIGTSHFEFAENCLVSYHKKAKAVCVLTDKEFHLFYESDHYKQVDFKQNKANIFYNWILEPALGLHKTLFLSQGGGDIFNLCRYQEPINEVYEEVFILGVPKY